MMYEVAIYLRVKLKLLYFIKRIWIQECVSKIDKIYDTFLLLSLLADIVKTKILKNLKVF